MKENKITKEELKNLVVSLAKENQKLKEIIMENKKITINFTKIARKYLSIRKNAISVSTYISYENIIENHLIKYFGDMIITDINVLMIEEYSSYKSLSVSSNTIKKHHIVLNLIFKFAIKIKILKNNPMVDINKAKITKPITEFYREEDLIKLIFNMKDTPIYALVLLCSLGLRRSEALAVKWEDIDFDSRELKIVAKIDVLNNYSLILKNRTSYRRIVIPKWFAKKFEEIKSCSKSEWVCSDKNGINHMSPSSASHSFKYYLEQKKLKPITLKGLRHSCATLISSQGYNLNYIKDWLGHSTIKITADIYSHTDMSDKKQISEKINSVFEDSFKSCL